MSTALTAQQIVDVQVREALADQLEELRPDAPRVCVEVAAAVARIGEHVRAIGAEVSAGVTAVVSAAGGRR